MRRQLSPLGTAGFVKLTLLSSATIINGSHLKSVWTAAAISPAREHLNQYFSQLQLSLIEHSFYGCDLGFSTCPISREKGKFIVNKTHLLTYLLVWKGKTVALGIDLNCWSYLSQKHESFDSPGNNSCSLKTKISRERGIVQFLKHHKNNVYPTGNAQMYIWDYLSAPRPKPSR